MAGIVLSSSVRQNLLSLQSTADLLSTTQNRLSTGKKVNTALDNPTNFFTAQGLDNRSGDISNLLDGISNGVQVIQAANTGLTSLQKLVDSAKSVANQALQAAVGYSTKSNVTTATIAGATAADLRGTAGAPTSAALTGAVTLNDNTGTQANITGATKLSGTPGSASDNLDTGFTTADTLTVNGTTISFVASGATGNQLNVTDDVDDLLAKIDAITGATGSAVGTGADAGKLIINTGTASDLTLGGSNGALAKIGLTAGVTARTPGATALGGLTLTIDSTGGGVATNITFGDGTLGTVKSLNDLNAKLADNNLQATINSAGAINITTSNDKASATIGAIGGTAADTGEAFDGLVGDDPVKDAAAQLVRANLVTQYNNILDQITSTSRDASYNGVNLLNNDALSLTFNETGTSKLKIQGVQFNATGLGLSQLTEFNDNSSATAAIATLSTASSTLRTQASTLGSNLSIVQIRQDFSKNLINVLQTGSSNLTLADTNEEAANSQALSTRQSIAVSALSLANQSQQSVLQLLR